MKLICGNCEHAKFDAMGLSKKEAKMLLYPYVCTLEKKRGKYYGADHICDKFAQQEGAEE